MKILVFGSGAHASAVIGVIEEEGKHQIIGLVDSFAAPGTMAYGYEVLGDESRLKTLAERAGTTWFFVAVGDNFHRERISRIIIDSIPKAQFITPVHPTAVVSRNATLGQGTILMPGVIVMSNAIIEDGCILNTRCTLEHDGEMQCWSSLAPSVTTGGHFRLGARSAMGLAAIAKQKVVVGDDTVIGAGSLLLENIPSCVVAFGQPCRPVRERERGEAYL